MVNMDKNNLDIINRIKSKDVNVKENTGFTLDFYTSWALYNLGEEEIRNYIPKKNRPLSTSALGIPDYTDEELSEKINTDVMIFALNAASRDVDKSGSWLNFHDTRSASHDQRLLFEFLDTKFWGAYMSDLFKDVPETNSKEIKINNLIKDMKSNDDNEAKRNLKLLQFEIDTINPRIIILYHAKARDAFNKMIKEELIKIPDNCKTVYRPHYSMGEGYAKRAKALIKESKEIYGE